MCPQVANRSSSHYSKNPSNFSFAFPPFSCLIMRQPAPDATDSEVGRLIASARQGSADALGRLLRTFQQYLALVADQGVDSGLRSKFGGSDVVQDTFLEAQRDFVQFQGATRGELLAWLRQLLLNNLLNRKRTFRDTQKRAVGCEQPAEALAGVVDDQSSPSQAAVRQEERQLLEAALGRLPAHYREVIILRDQQQLQFAEIGRQMERTEDAARMLWARAFERLAEALEADS